MKKMTTTTTAISSFIRMHKLSPFVVYRENSRKITSSFFKPFELFLAQVRRAAGRHDKDEALRRNALLPTYTLHHLVKERYPRFQDALSDLDDALTLTYLFASLPGQGHLSAKVTSKAKSLAAAWGAYCATTSSITKSFISIKGVYLESCIQGVDIRWIVPHAFTQYLPTDVDYRVSKYHTSATLDV